MNVCKGDTTIKPNYKQPGALKYYALDAHIIKAAGSGKVKERHRHSRIARHANM